MGKLGNIVSVGTLKVKKNAPQIMIFFGVAGMIYSAVKACKATVDLVDITNEKDEIEKKIEKEITNEEELAKKIRDTKIRYYLDVAKLYTPSVIICMVSVSSIFWGNRIFIKRNAALSTILAATNTGFKEYRRRITDKYGEEADKYGKFGFDQMEVKEQIIDEETGKKKTVKSKLDVTDDTLALYSQYARYFDESSPYWEKTAEYNQMFLRIKQNYFNEMLKAKKFIFLNDVYEALGIPRTQAGQFVGWVYDENNPIGDNYIDFGIYDVRRSSSRDFVNGYENAILLDFNVDGEIVHLI